MAQYTVFFQTPSEKIVDSRHATLDMAEGRRDYCSSLLHKVNASEDVKAKIEKGWNEPV
tara:strand:- start:447 stop:623 length:177 start_codon:yes stop_codon:yes gene_type:complete